MQHNNNLENKQNNNQEIVISIPDLTEVKKSEIQKLLDQLEVVEKGIKILEGLIENPPLPLSVRCFGINNVRDYCDLDSKILLLAFFVAVCLLARSIERFVNEGASSGEALVEGMMCPLSFIAIPTLWRIFCDIRLNKDRKKVGHFPSLDKEMLTTLEQIAHKAQVDMYKRDDPYNNDYTFKGFLERLKAKEIQLKSSPVYLSYERKLTFLMGKLDVNSQENKEKSLHRSELLISSNILYLKKVLWI